MENLLDFQWTENDLLHSGFGVKTCDGFRKTNKEQVKVKVFEKEYYNKEEFQMLLPLRHSSIATTLAADVIIRADSLLKDCYVVITEICSRGTLANILVQTKNQNGLCDETFVLLLSCLRNALEYLHGLDIVHRDIRPANIALHCGTNGADEFKLLMNSEIVPKQMKAGDCLTEDLVGGALEYLHPLLNQLYLGLPPKGGTTQLWRQNKPFIDFWSVGATLFEAASGRKAFQVLESFNDIDVAYKLHGAYAMKHHDTIAMREEEANGGWLQTNSLPSSTNISRALENVIVPLMVGLLAKDVINTCSLEAFVGQCDTIMQTSRSTDEVDSADSKGKMNYEELAVEHAIMKQKLNELEEKFRRFSNFSSEEALHDAPNKRNSEVISEQAYKRIPSATYAENDIYIEATRVIRKTYISHWSGLRPICCRTDGVFPLIDWTQLDGFHDWKSEWRRIVSKKVMHLGKLIFPPIWLPSEYGSYMIELWILWNDGLTLNGKILLPIKNDASISVPLEMEVSIAEIISWQVEHLFVFTKQPTTFCSLTSMVNKKWKLPKVKVAIIKQLLSDLPEQENA